MLLKRPVEDLPGILSRSSVRTRSCTCRRGEKTVAPKAPVSPKSDAGSVRSPAVDDSQMVSSQNRVKEWFLPVFHFRRRLHFAWAKSYLLDPLGCLGGCLFSMLRGLRGLVWSDFLFKSLCWPCWENATPVMGLSLRLEKSNLQEKSRSSRPELFLEIGSPEVWRDGQDNLQGWEMAWCEPEVRSILKAKSCSCIFPRIVLQLQAARALLDMVYGLGSEYNITSDEDHWGLRAAEGPV